MKYVIVLLIFLSLGCSDDPKPNSNSTPEILELETPVPFSAINLSIHIDGNSFFYENKEMDSKEITTLVQKTKKENPKMIMEIKPKPGAKTEAIVFLMDLAQRENLEAIFEIVD